MHTQEYDPLSMARGSIQTIESPSYPTGSHIILTPMTPSLQPSLSLLLTFLGRLPNSKTPLHPLPTSHLRKPRQSTRKRKALLVTAENRRVLQRLH